MFPGIFLDFDLQCLRPLDPLRQFDFVSVAAKPSGISNGFLMSSPRHPFLKSVVENLPRYNINWFGLPYATVMFSTGCHFLSYVAPFHLHLISKSCSHYTNLCRTIHAFFPNRDDLRILWGPNRLHHLSGAVTTPLFRHFGMSSWHSFDGAALTTALPLVIFTIAFVTSSIIFAVLGWIKFRHRAHRVFSD